MAGEEEVLPVLGAVAGFSPEGAKKTVGCWQGGQKGLLLFGYGRSRAVRTAPSGF